MTESSKQPAAHRNIVMHASHVSSAERAALLGQQPRTLWLTGLSASGKSTLAFALEKALTDAGRACYVLDGDNVRHGLNSNLGFSAEDRTENIRRIAEVAKLMNEAGLIVITAFISPMLADRSMAKAIIGEHQFSEIYVSTPLAACEARDPKGLYVKARAGELANFTGISAAYQPPIAPDLSIDTSIASIEDNLKQLMLICTFKPTD
jgi:adenylylsulfate kinase